MKPEDALLSLLYAETMTGIDSEGKDFKNNVKQKDRTAMARPFFDCTKSYSSEAADNLL
ncbi:hypothetical protein [uncultured Dialister sp.]|uniref:hypothetical protein n=1 Tax=uncultured Dialister sp. TaxID=278064 RepID=UPI0026DB95E5|nr:hypothetical protein [uncultured Dialister sp.]